MTAKSQGPGSHVSLRVALYVMCILFLNGFGDLL